MFFSRIKVLIIFACISILIIGLLLFINTSITNIISAVFGSIVASIAVSGFYNENLHAAMDKYNKIGLINYFENFEDAHGEIKEKISNAKRLDIFVMFGDSFLNTSTVSIQKMLSKENSKFRYFMYDVNNKFIESYGNHWGNEGNNPTYNKEGIIGKIEKVRQDLKRITADKNTKCTFELFEIKSAPISYSFYLIDNDLYFVPSKNVRAKEIKPPVLHFKKTKNENGMFSKIELELNKMIENNEVNKIIP